MENKVIIVGKAASGKDYLREYFEGCGLLVCVSDTTRPPREGEVPGKEYNFIDKYTFLKRKFNAEYLESGYFNTWFYGTPVREWNEKDVFILTPSAISLLDSRARESATIIFLDIDEDTLRSRLSERGDIDSVERRIKSDNKDFLDFQDFDIRISEPEFCAGALYEYLMKPTKMKRAWLTLKNRMQQIKHLKF